MEYSNIQSSFSNQQFQCRYRSGDKSALPKDFYNAILPLTKIYCRAVGFFSSTCFLEISYGIIGLLKNNGKMLLITSPRLQDDDVKAIENGYSKKEIYLKAFIRAMVIPKNITEKNRLNVLANLIESGKLEVKIAITDNPAQSMYHEKIGLFIDDEGNKIAISGSMNESRTAMTENFESFDVACSWKQGDAERVTIRENDFYQMWHNEQDDLQVIDFPELPKEFIQKYKTHTVTESDVNSELEENFGVENKIEQGPFFSFPPEKAPRAHQKLAVKQFIENNFQCLFAMATGTGKTLTSLYAANALSYHIDLRTILIIVPLKDLVDQWEKDIKEYSVVEVLPIRSGIEWKEKLESLNLLKMLSKESESKKLVIITTYDSFSLNDEKILRYLEPGTSLIIADEVHKFGAESYSKKLPGNLIYRIGLSATPKRPYDDKGTAAIFDYFCPSGNVFEFTIKDAIDNDMLCHYNYYPILVPLTDDEMDAYEEISDKISKLSMIVNSSKTESKEDKERLEQLLKQRHRIIERAENKKDLFISLMCEQTEKYKDKTLVFCPDGTDENNKDLLISYKTDLWQELRKERKIVVMNEYVQGTKRKVIEDFTTGAIDILFAKQRLNEGIDIPSTRRAFFIASSTSEREFIQRRGRVLRKSKGKTLAEIFDFVVIPPDKNSVYAKSITNNEIKRAMDFAVTADNYKEIAQRLRDYL